MRTTHQLLTVILGLLLTGGVTSAEGPVPKLDWKSCTEPQQLGFDCATAQVPLDYRNPQGATLDLAVIRHLATDPDPDRRLGVLFFNPGGPGEPGTEALPLVLNFFDATLRERFDLISWDPRGVGASTAVQCFATEADEDDFFAETPPFPVGPAEQRAWSETTARFSALCGERNGDLLVHVSTAATAKDLDLLRQAVGETHLNYRGNSYGTFLGAIYANLFPDQVRAMVLDGNVDPVAYTNGGHDHAFLNTDLRARADVASARTLDAFLERCGQASTSQCAFSAGSAAATQQKFARLLERVRAHPLTVGTQTYPYADLVFSMVGSLYLVSSWPATAELLRSLCTSPQSGAPLTSPDAAAAGLGVASPRLSAGAVERYNGPWDRPTAHPILVIGNTFDPATPYKGAIAMARTLAQARLLTVDGYGHGSLRNPSTCARTYEVHYFVDGTLPPPGTVCPQDQAPFAASPAP